MFVAIFSSNSISRLQSLVSSYERPGRVRAHVGLTGMIATILEDNFLQRNCYSKASFSPTDGWR
jgi:hypothetical protein